MLGDEQDCQDGKAVKEIAQPLEAGRIGEGKFESGKYDVASVVADGKDQVDQDAERPAPAVPTIEIRIGLPVHQEIMSHQ